jgi:uncharacterized protein YraI
MGNNRMISRLVLVMALVVVACGDSTGTSTTTAPGSSSSTEGTAAPSTSAPTTTTSLASQATAGSSTTIAGGFDVAVGEFCVTGTASDDTLNLRAGPGTEFEDIGDLAFDATGVRNTGAGAYDQQGRPWFEVAVGDGTAWVASWFLIAAPCEASSGLVEPDDVGDDRRIAAQFVVLGHNGFSVGDAFFPLGFGHGVDDDEVVAVMTDWLWPPVFDSGWEPDPNTPGAERRRVVWGDVTEGVRTPGSGFTLYFSNDVGKPDTTPGGLLCDPVCLNGFSFGGQPGGIATVMPGITVGSTIGEVTAAVSVYRPEVGLNLFEWVEGAWWQLEAGNGEFGILCFATGPSGFQPPDTAVVRHIGAGFGPGCSPDGDVATDPRAYYLVEALAPELGGFAVARDGAIVRGTQDAYVVDYRSCCKGDTLYATISSPEGNAVFSVYGPGGELLASEATTVDLELEAGGEYWITVGSTRGNASYSIEIGLSEDAS